MTFSKDIHEDRSYYLPLLIILSIISHFPFVLNGFGEIDATKIAVSVIDMLNHGQKAAFANFYFTGVIPLYIVYLSWFTKLLNNNYTYLPLIMNYTNAVFGTLTVIPAFILIKRLFGNPTVAFCTVLALIFAPSFYQATIMGFPHLIAFFFLLVSLCFYLSGLDHDHTGTVYLLMFLSGVFLTIAFLFKSDIVLAAGTYIGLLFVRKVKDKGKIGSAFIIVLVSGLLFLFLRDLMLGPISSGATTSKEGLSKWYEYSLIIPTNFDYLIRQTKPIAYGAGIATFCIGAISFVYFLFKKRFDVLAFIVSWAALPILFWIVMIGNNARHNMITTLPVLAMIILFFHERLSKYVILLTTVLILVNFFIVPPSSSILTPSGNLFKSNTMLEERMSGFHSGAKDLVGIDEDRIVVLGFFHNPHVIFEIMNSGQPYEAIKIGREDYKITTADKEFVFVYFVAGTPEEMNESISNVLKRYSLDEHVFSSVTYDLWPLKERGLRTKEFEIIKRSSL